MCENIQTVSVVCAFPFFPSCVFMLAVMQAFIPKVTSSPETITQNSIQSASAEQDGTKSEGPGEEAAGKSFQ